MMHGKVFVPTRYQGYYWNVERKTLFSTKGKELRELRKGSWYSITKRRQITGYSVYVRARPGEKRGHSEIIEMSELLSLNKELTISLDKIIILLPEELFVI